MPTFDSLFSRLFLACCFFVVLAIPLRATGPELLLHYQFDGVTELAPDQSKRGADAKLHHHPQARLAKFSAGVSGIEGDQAFDNQSATGMGKGALGSKLAATEFECPPLTSFTITGWYKLAKGTPLGKAARILHILDEEKNSLAVMCGKDGLVLIANGGKASSAPAYTEQEAWIFFAITYQEGKALVGSDVTFYKGGRNLPVEEAGGGKLLPPLPGGVFTGIQAPSDLAIGNEPGKKKSSFDRPFKGLVDDLRLYGAEKGTSGALTQEAMEAIRQEALKFSAKPASD